MSEWSNKPIIFDDNRITRPYIGGKLLNEWRKMDPAEDNHNCEELLISSIGAISKGHEEGYAISKTIPSQGSVSLKSIIENDPDGILGEKYNKKNPNNLSVLARAGDTVVRLVLQCHPKEEDAKKYFNSICGKTEAWYIARTRKVEGEENCVYAGFKKHVTKKLWQDLCKKQDVEKMRECLHKIPVKEGDVILIPAGMPHAVGPGCLFLEIHESSDITIRAERNINGVVLTDEEMFNGLSFNEGIGLFDFETYTIDEIKNKVVMKEKEEVIIQNNSRLTQMIDYSDTNAFGMQIIDIRDEFVLPNFEGHRIMVAINGDVKLEWSEGTINLTQGHGALIPYKCNDLKLIASNAKVMIGLPTEL
ncbi:class I mannose-6-phosphate isomerase [Irregularibacter muris]|uniref:Class I mannose-6-phosphate isomerase n=1 Tax=Irregularibacter muris TaxID=1796619 RepID=A0AAE3L444_9FIRM|nr:class I mannose-6-phosphate isomerase [Irregularibacter muris]MCR1899403.1 class I mannose-6-phosphate isomerase [Irregularibacter muris]